jgi:hypothetical protein
VRGYNSIRSTKTPFDASANTPKRVNDAVTIAAWIGPKPMAASVVLYWAAKSTQTTTKNAVVADARRRSRSDRIRKASIPMPPHNGLDLDLRELAHSFAYAR